MIHAMHKKTQIECEEIVCDAINTCTVQANAKYISRNYQKNSRQWSLWARQHLPLLLQITSTNPLESYNSEIKKLITEEVHAISKRLVKGKCTPNLATNILMPKTWSYFQRTFEASSMKVYQTRNIVELPVGEEKYRRGITIR
ncbi:21056_t:CDS:2 [Gigaspora rosea]|nr:21056_t:CDS:2 [Gigaspora rosea]